MPEQSLTQGESRDNMNYSRKTDQWVLHQGEFKKENIGYMPGLDGLRALAVFAVIAYHLDLGWAQGGLLGVSLFFVLSGYLITNILLKQWERTGSMDLKDFWLRRARRLLPGLFFMLISVTLWAAMFSLERLVALKQEVIAAVCYSSNWYLILHQVSYFERFGPPSPLGHLWSLAVEEQFYLIWPLLMVLGLRYLPRRKWIIGGTVAFALISVGAMAAIYIPGHDPSRVYYGTDTRAFALLVGAVLAMGWPSRKGNAELSVKSRLALDLAGSAGLLIVLWMIGNTNQYAPFLYWGGLFLFSVAAACLIAALAHPDSYLGKFFAWRPLRWLGECSYGIYLWHYPVIVLTSPAVNTGEPDYFRSACQIAATIILAALSRYLIEDPIRYGRRKRTRRTAANFHGWRRPLHLGVRILVSILLVCTVFFATAMESTESSAKNPEKSQSIEKQREANGEEALANGDDITAIGDSLILDVEPVLQASLPGIIIDGKIGRQMHQAPEVIENLQKEDRLREIVIIELGTNGSFTEKQLAETLDELNGKEKIILVNTRVPRPWEAVVNETLTKGLEPYKNVILLDWYALSSGHEDYFYSDGVHLKQPGAQAYSEMILDALSSEQKVE